MARGIAVLVSKDMRKVISHVFTDDQGRMIIFDIQQEDTKLTIAAIYAPNSDTPAFFSSLREKLKERQVNKIIVGDFNLTLNIELDRLNTYCNNNKSKEVVEDIMDEFLLVDVWRTQNESRKEFSWRKKRTVSKSQ